MTHKLPDRNEMTSGSQQCALLCECVWWKSEIPHTEPGTFSSQKQSLTAEGKVKSPGCSPPACPLCTAGTGRHPCERQTEHSYQCVHLWVALTDTALHPGVTAWPQLGTEQGTPAQHWNLTPVSNPSSSLLLVSQMYVTITCYAEPAYRIFSRVNIHFPCLLTICPEFPRAKGGMGEPISTIDRAAQQSAN